MASVTTVGASDVLTVVTVSSSISLGGFNETSENLESAVTATLAQVLGVDESSVSVTSVEYVPGRRRQLAWEDLIRDGVGRRLADSLVVNFEVVLATVNSSLNSSTANATSSSTVFDAITAVSNSSSTLIGVLTRELEAAGEEVPVNFSVAVAAPTSTTVSSQYVYTLWSNCTTISGSDPPGCGESNVMGSQIRTVLCVDANTGTELTNASCSSLTKPDTSQDCIIEPSACPSVTTSDDDGFDAAIIAVIVLCGIVVLVLLAAVIICLRRLLNGTSRQAAAIIEADAAQRAAVINAAAVEEGDSNQVASNQQAVSNEANVNVGL
eukprot:NODE_4639_length_1866_cov_7.648074.p1 GENE.NODE_4639_length_1866_cov_7.648074~~NODE_4639_length_1866_cov_7.648074.p1  ORF type:complete len:324 (-),score=71.48 NODE_4639_length_1866_cov_7.648074:399-1370(-)